MTIVNGITQLINQAQPVAVIVDVVPVGLARRRADLCAIHREIRAAQEADAIGCVDGRAGDADAGAHTDAHCVENEWLLELGDETVGDGNRIFRRGVHDEHGEFVTAHAHENVGIAKATRQARTQLSEDVVACGVTERIIDLLEVIEVHVQE